VEHGRQHLRHLNRRESTYWILAVLLLTVLSATVILQFLTIDDWLPRSLIQNDQYRRTLSVGLPGLVILFCLYVTTKRREIRGLKEELYNQLTLLRRLEDRTEELEKTLHELKRVNRLKDMLLSTVSHELQTPLSSIYSVSQILLNYGDKDAESREKFYKMIHHETKRLSGLVANLLDLAKIESGRIAWDLSVQDPREVMQSALAVTGVIAAERDISLREEIEPNLPHLLVDRDRVTQVMTNLIGNAIKFTPKGGTITVVGAQVDWYGGGKAVQFSVRDTGPGVPEEERERIFDWFERSAREKSGRTPGSGLGLAIARQIVEHFGGKIWVEDSPGGGSEFIFTIPVKPIPERHATAAANPTEVAGIS